MTTPPLIEFLRRTWLVVLYVVFVVGLAILTTYSSP